jgi:hypothetical protein
MYKPYEAQKLRLKDVKRRFINTPKKTELELNSEIVQKKPKSEIALITIGRNAGEECNV